MKRESETKLLAEIEQRGSFTMKANELLRLKLNACADNEAPLGEDWSLTLEWAKLHNLTVAPMTEPMYPDDPVTLAKAKQLRA